MLTITDQTLARRESGGVIMLPFDNKSEFQVVLDMPEGTALEQTTRVLDEMAL